MTMSDDARHTKGPTLPAAFSDASMAAIVDVLQDLIVVLTPVLGASNEVTDFEFTEVTGPLELLESPGSGTVLGSTLRGRLDEHALSQLLPACVHGIEFGQPISIDGLRYVHDRSGERFFDVRGGRIRDTLACTWRDVTARHELLERYQEVVEHSADVVYHWSRLRVLLVTGEKGQVVGRVGSFHDIGDEMATRQELIDSEARYRILMENESDIVFRTRLDTSIEWVSPSVETLTGWSPEEITGHRVAEFVVAEDRSALALVILDVIGGNAASFQGRLAKKDGGFRWVAVRARPLASESGETVGAVVNVRDVHDEVLAREALGESEQRFRLALESAPIGMAVVDLDHHFVEVNPALADLIDHEESWLLGRHVTEVLDIDLATLERFLETELNSRRSNRSALERQLIRQDDAEIWVEFSAGIIR